MANYVHFKHQELWQPRIRGRGRQNFDPPYNTTTFSFVWLIRQSRKHPFFGLLGLAVELV